MFYIKAKLGQGLEMKVDIHDKNVFTRCPYCGTEFAVDLVEVLSDGECDLHSSAVVCTACTQKVRG